MKPKKAKSQSPWSFSPFMVVTLVIVLRTFLGLDLAVAVVLAVMITIIFTIYRNAKRPSTLPPLPPATPSDSVQTSDSEESPTSLPTTWGKNEHATQKTDRAVEPLRVSIETPIHVAQSSVVTQAPIKPASNYKATQPKHAAVPTRPDIVLPDLHSPDALRQAIITMTILGPCKALDAPNQHAISPKVR